MDSGSRDGEGALTDSEVRVWACSAEDIEHYGWAVGRKRGGWDGKIEDGAEMGFKLGHGAGVDGVVALVGHWLNFCLYR